jgi:glutamyl-tRNA reductase
MQKNKPVNRRPFVVGANHRTAGLSVRDRLFLEDLDVPGFLGRLKEIGVDEALVLSTCDRVEIQGQHASPEQIDPEIRTLLAEHAGLALIELADQLYLKTDDDAVRHVFSVAASLDSQVVGEPQVLGQLKAAHRLARQSGVMLGAFEGLLQAAYGAAKRVRTETAIGERPVSIAAAGAELVRGLHGDLSRVSAILMGVGELGELIARHFQDCAIKHLSVFHPISNRAAPLARHLECHVVEDGRLADALGEADLIICAMGRRHHVLTSDMVRAALKARRNKPQFIIDTGIPGDVEPAVNRIDDAFVYDTSDLESAALDGKANREKEAEDAAKIVEEDVAGFLRSRLERDAVPALTALRHHFGEVREQALAEVGDDAARASELMINRLLDHPSRVLREAAGTPHAPDMERVVKNLFNLENTDDKETPS